MPRMLDGMRVVIHDTAAAFWSVAGPLFTADPVHNTVELTVFARLRRGVGYGPGSEILLTVHKDDRVIGAAVCTPPHPLRVNALPESTFPAVIDHLRRARARLPGVAGPVDAARAFAAGWTAGTDLGAEPIRTERLYVLDELVPPTDVPGHARLGAEADLAVLTRFRREFAEEALSRGERPADPRGYADRTRDALASGSSSMLWLVDDTPVAVAVASRPSSGMSRIGPVYTPPEHRGHGYGSAVTAAVTTWVRGIGAQCVVLFTDLANPTSNSIYQKIGYRPLTDFLGMNFTSSG
jgi:GNAT superfamily N-acetyltransferase